MPLADPQPGEIWWKISPEGRKEVGIHSIVPDAAHPVVRFHSWWPEFLPSDTLASPREIFLRSFIICT